MKKYGAIYLAATGEPGSSHLERIRKSEVIAYEDLVQKLSGNRVEEFSNNCR